jgi:choline dehydrogenase
MHCWQVSQALHKIGDAGPSAARRLAMRAGVDKEIAVMAQDQQMTFDYVIVGAGSAGCVLANRLSADKAVRVCLIEAGPSDHGLFTRLLVNIPAFCIGLMTNPRFNWLYDYDAEPRLGGRKIFCPRGRILGGSSAINGSIYIRGHRADYDRWAALGNKGWSYADVLPYFKKSEHWELGKSELHGDAGELNVTYLRDPHPICENFLSAADQLQYSRNDDFNGADQEGFGHFQVTQRNGERISTARGFLHPVMNRPNLTVLTAALTEQIVIDGRRAVGVAIRKNGQKVTIPARREVIVAAGAVNSPQLLLLSGIGAGVELRRHGIEVHHDLPGVGENLQDHQDVAVVQSSSKGSLYGLSLRALPWMALSPFQYVFARRGPWTTNTVEAGGFVRTDPKLKQPDVELILAPALKNQPERTIPLGHGFSIHVSLLQPKSRGRLTLKSPNPEDSPLLKPNFLDHPDDLAGLVRGTKLVRRLIAAPAFASYRGAELSPGPAVQSDAEIADWVHRTVATTYHPVGTCKMGNDPMAVVDSELKVRGVEALRVIDASIMPMVTSGNTNAPVIMIAEKGANMILADGRHRIG